jgi:hypothetical protein
MLTNKVKLQLLESEMDTLIKDGNKMRRRMEEIITKIRDEGLWVDTHKSFKSYLRDRWGKSPQWARNLQNAHVVRKQLTEQCHSTTATVVGVLPEGAMREIAKLPEGKRVEVLESAAKNGKPTAAAIKEAAKIVKPEPLYDEEGCELTQECMAAWNRRAEVQEILTQLSRMKSILQKSKESEDMLYLSEINWDHAWEDVQQLYHQFKKCKPYAVCLFCSGHPKVTKCTECGGRGVISEKFYFDDKNDEVKQAREIRTKFIQSKKPHEHSATRLPTRGDSQSSCRV